MSQQPADGRNIHDDASSILTPGTLCTIIAGCPENIGLIVEVVSRLGAARGYQDGYRIRTTSGRFFAQLWQGQRAARGASSEAFTERWKLRPLVIPPMDKANDVKAVEGLAEARAAAAQPVAMALKMLVAQCRAQGMNLGLGEVTALREHVEDVVNGALAGVVVEEVNRPGFSRHLRASN